MSVMEPILPVVVIDSPDAAEGLGRALLAGGIRQVEVTLRTAEALPALRILASVPGLRAGAGTVLTADQVHAAVEAGAEFVVSPGLDEGVVAACQRYGVPAIPGVVTATELMRARSLGLRTVKFFPAEQAGGVAAVSALSAVFADMAFVPTGGIGADRAAVYAALPSVVAVGGSWMVPRDAVASGQFARIEALCRQAVEVFQ
ncbi:keto-deoxy-phosphogluconate aldolase [Terrabacter sp. 28]|nr:keto-deoxy-phosphogluconate aldolase [Terrabacter sp. 28]